MLFIYRLLIFNNEKKLFLGERNNSNGIWQFPQGGVEAGFTLEENVVREAAEELGAEEQLFVIKAKLNLINQYDFMQTPEVYKDIFRGQSQTFWLVEYLGNDEDIQLDRHIPEFRSYKWMSVDEVVKNAEPLRLPAYLKALGEASVIIDLKRF